MLTYDYAKLVAQKQKLTQKLDEVSDDIEVWQDIYETTKQAIITSENEKGQWVAISYHCYCGVLAVWWVAYYTLMFYFFIAFLLFTIIAFAIIGFQSNILITLTFVLLLVFTVAFIGDDFIAKWFCCRTIAGQNFISRRQLISTNKISQKMITKHTHKYTYLSNRIKEINCQLK